MPVNVMVLRECDRLRGWDGRVVIKDSSLEIRLATPTALGGDGQGNNPEQLFAAGYSVSFLGSMKFVESEGGPKVPADTTVTAIVGIGPRARGGFRARHSTRDRRARPAAQRGRGSGAESTRGLPLFEGHPRQRRRSHRDRMTRLRGQQARGANRCSVLQIRG